MNYRDVLSRVVKDGIRPPRPVLHMLTAFLWSSRSVCRRKDRKCGAVVTSSDLRRIISIGYNGPAKGLPDEECTGLEGNCRCLHAEDNAVSSMRSNEYGAVLFTTMMPCVMCAQRIVQADIDRVYYVESYRSDEGIKILEKCGTKCERLQVT